MESVANEKPSNVNPKGNFLGVDSLNTSILLHANAPGNKNYINGRLLVLSKNGVINTYIRTFFKVLRVEC